MTEGLTVEAIRQGLATTVVGRGLEVHAEIDSTNTRAVVLAREGAPDGTVVVAEAQTAGRGRLGRRWYAPAGSALLLSILLRPNVAPLQAQRLTMIVSLAAVEAIGEVSGLPAEVKWPNDILLRGKKLGGMLTELSVRGDRLDYVVVGLGLNVNLDLSALPEVSTPATSLLAELGQPVSRVVLLRALLRRVDDYYARVRVGWSPHEAWRERLATLGQPVTVGTPEEVIEGQAEDVDADGALLVRLPDGSLRRVLVGDVTLRGHTV